VAPLPKVNWEEESPECGKLIAQREDGTGGLRPMTAKDPGERAADAASARAALGAIRQALGY